ncbi:MAG: DegV family protein [Dehalococcoidales bacterium]|nr:DegV family protein [Dehalococcoidales bacterium]
MNKKVKIVTDSSAFLTPEEISRYDVGVVPLKLMFGKHVYNEGVDITNEEFYRRIGKVGVMPTTSLPTEADFLQAYQEPAEMGRPILSLHISSVLSGTVGLARAVKQEIPGAQIEVVDSRSLALRMLIAPAARLANSGQSLASIKASIEKLNAAIGSLGVPSTLEYLLRGGRIGKAKALLGALLSIKPVLGFEGGEVKVIAKPRTSAKAIDQIIEMMQQRMKADIPVHASVIHTGAIREAEILQQKAQASFNCAETELIELSPVLGAHVGPGFFGIGFYSDRDWLPD